jgi:pimeloyl-ACP methyl ester carboxylesterase
VNRLDLDEVVLIGHSLGGDVIVDAARLLPGRVRGLVWVDVYNQLDRFRTRAEIDERSAPFHASFVERTREFVRVMFPRGADPALVERVATDMSAAPPEVALPLLNAAWTNGPHLIATLDELNLPVVALNADDQPTNVASMKRHGVDVTVMSGVGHFLMMEDPERFNEILIGVVEALHRRESAVGS